MPRRKHPAAEHGPPETGEREAAVLKAVARDYVASGEPVSSGRVAQASGLHLSPASIRSIMAALERAGLLEQPHASAGRVPSERGWRLFVDDVLDHPRRVAPAAARRIESALAARAGETPELLGAASRQLAELSQHVGVVLTPALPRIVVRRAQFVRLDARRVATILVGEAGTLHHRTLWLDAAPEQDELERIGCYLSEQLGGRTLVEMRDALAGQLGREREALGRLQGAALALCTAALAEESDDVAVFVEGAARLLAADLADLDLVRALFQALEQKALLVQLLDRLLEGDGVRVMIGAENPLSDVAPCAVVASTWGPAGRVVGTVGIIGPLRMEYGRLIPLVAHVARTLSRFDADPN